jgi:osmoprotectant transport system permease protein
VKEATSAGAGEAVLEPTGRSRVLPVLLTLGVVAAFALAFVTVAPNRLVTGRGVPLSELLYGWRLALLLPAAALVAAAALRPARLQNLLIVGACGALLAALAWMAGDEAQRLTQNAIAVVSADTVPTQRVSFGGAFWCLVLLTWLAAADALQRLELTPTRRFALHIALWIPTLVLLAAGRLDQTSILQEWAQREEVFAEAFWRHLQIVAWALVPALALALPLGVAAARHARFGRGVLALLSVVQTIPSIALFGLLIAPLAALGALWPSSGIQGIGLAPALVALVAYALLPIVAGVAAGLQQIEPGVMAAATGMGLTPRQRLWQVALPLALPSLLSALRVAAVQMVGAAVVAALIGAGGLGSLIFQGLTSSALDLVLLGVVPVVLLAMAVDSLLSALAASMQRGQVSLVEQGRAGASGGASGGADRSGGAGGPGIPGVPGVVQAQP